MTPAMFLYLLEQLLYLTALLGVVWVITVVGLDIAHRAGYSRGRRILPPQMQRLEPPLPPEAMTYSKTEEHKASVSYTSTPLLSQSVPLYHREGEDG